VKPVILNNHGAERVPFGKTVNSTLQLNGRPQEWRKILMK
jgi:hypothetical protein